MYVEKLIINNLTSKELTFFKDPIIIPLSSLEGIPLNFLTQIGLEQGSIPQGLSLIVKYENGNLAATLKAKSEISNNSKFSIPVPNIASIGNTTSKHFEEYKKMKIYYDSFYTKIIKGLDL